jgi:predicted nuclease of restriction endonuclease-like (RecB) superfamily
MSKAISTQKVYSDLLIRIKQQVSSIQAKAALAVNTSLIQLYWNLGEMIADNQALFEGRNNYVAQLEKDLRSEFPDMKGFSRANLFFIRKFYQFYSDSSVQQLVGLNDEEQSDSLQQVVAISKSDSVEQPVRLKPELLLVPWGHHVLIINKIKKIPEAFFYLQQIVEHNWSRSILTLQIEQDLFRRQGKAITNFKNTLPEQQAKLAGQILKDPYNFGFLTLEPQVN